MRIAIVVVLAGCWSATAPPPEPVHNRAEPPRRAEPFPEHSVWSGHYVCAQGITALTLSIDAADSGSATAVFEFGPLLENPVIPSGSFRMSGTLREIGGALALELAPNEWLVQPPGYVSVGLSAETDRDRRILRGRIAHDGCGELVLERVD